MSKATRQCIEEYQKMGEKNQTLRLKTLDNSSQESISDAGMQLHVKHLSC